MMNGSMDAVDAEDTVESEEEATSSCKTLVLASSSWNKLHTIYADSVVMFESPCSVTLCVCVCALRVWDLPFCRMWWRSLSQTCIFSEEISDCECEWSVEEEKLQVCLWVFARLVVLSLLWIQLVNTWRLS